MSIELHLNAATAGIPPEFSYCGRCNCTGTLNVKYEHKGFIIYHLPKRKLFHLKKDNHYLVKNEPINNLCEKLKQHCGIGLAECSSAS